MKQFRKTRKKLKRDHPELLDRIQALYLEQQKQERAQQNYAETKEIPIDRNKSIETVIKFLELSDSEDIQKRIRSVLAGALH